MKKVLSSFLTVFLVFGFVVSPSYASSENTTSLNKDASLSVQDNMIEIVEPYVEVKKDGTIGFKNNVPESVYELYELDKLQEHFDSLNSAVHSGNITINQNLTIIDHSISTFSTYGKWTNHWWGFDRKFNNRNAKFFAKNADDFADGATIVTGITALLPPVSALAAVQAGYWKLVAKRVRANNQGNGVYIGVTWVAIFNVEPL